MTTALYVATFVCLAIIIFWYVLDEATRGGKGRSGLLRMSDDTPRPKTDQPAAKRPWRVRG
jgi:hypothetical protein